MANPTKLFEECRQVASSAVSHKKAEALAAEIERVARSFAERALRQVACVDEKRYQANVPSIAGYGVTATLPPGDGTSGPGFASRAEAEAWLTKSIALAIAAAEKDK